MRDAIQDEFKTIEKRFWRETFAQHLCVTAGLLL